MPPLNEKLWYTVPHDLYPASTTLPLGQLISSIDDISHSLNRTTLIQPESSVINNTIQTDSTIEVFKNRALHTKLGVTAPGAPASGYIGGGGDGKESVKIVVDVVQTQSFSPSDSYAKDVFNASRSEMEMINYLKKKKLGLKVPVGTKNIFMITARKIGKKMTVNRDEVSGFDAKAKTGLDVQPGVGIEAGLDADWKGGVKIGGFSENPSVFAVQVRKVLYHADPKREVMTGKYVKSAVFGKEEEEVEGNRDDTEDIAVEYEGVSVEGPRVDNFDFDIISVGEEKFVVKADD